MTGGRIKENTADESMYGHSELKRDFQAKLFQKRFTLVPPRPGTDRDARLSSRDSALQSLQVQGICCSLQQRSSSQKMTHRPMQTQHSREAGDGRLKLLSSVNGRMERTAPPAPVFRMGSRHAVTPKDGTPALAQWRLAFRESADTHTTFRDNEKETDRGQPSTTKLSKLHIYLPSSLCDDEEQDAKTEVMRYSADETGHKKYDVKPSN